MVRARAAAVSYAAASSAAASYAAATTAAAAASNAAAAYAATASYAAAAAADTANAGRSEAWDRAISILDGALRIGRQSPEFDESEIRASIAAFERARVAEPVR